jgi:hypothetical protein
MTEKLAGHLPYAFLQGAKKERWTGKNDPVKYQEQDQSFEIDYFVLQPSGKVCRRGSIWM